MSIKEELEKLRKQQQQLENEMKKENKKKDNEIKSQQKIEKELIKFRNKKSELAKRIYEEFSQNNEEVNEKIKQIEEKIENCKGECLQIQNRIDEFCSDTSLYIKEQVDYLISELMIYVEKNERSLGENIITKFRICPYEISVGRVPYNYWKPTGDFIIKQDNEEKEEGVAITKDYYFDNRIVIGQDDWKYILSDWYQKYEKDFIKLFLENLKKDFHSENFKVDVDETCDWQGKFTIELI